jgi:hypothetical protein
VTDPPVPINRTRCSSRHRRVRAWTVALSVALAPVLFSGDAVAADGPSDVDKDAARTLVQQGDALLEKRDYEGALEAYSRADDIMGVPTTSIEVGRVALELTRLLEARDAFDRAASYPKKKGEPKPFTAARKAAKKELEKVNRRIPRLLVTVEGVDKDVDVEVLVDGEVIGVATETALDPGIHEITASAAGYVTATESIDLGEYALEDVTVSMRKARTSLWPMVWAGFGVAGAGVIIGAVTGGLSLKDASETKEACEPGDPTLCPDEAPLDRARVFAHVSTASFVIAGVAAGVGVAGLVISLSADDEGSGSDGVAANVVVGPGSLSVVGRF